MPAMDTGTWYLMKSQPNWPGLLDVHDDMVIYGVGDTDEQADADQDRN